MALTIARAHQKTVWRLGYKPSPWDWTDWRFAPDGNHFEGRWDSSEGTFRVLYASDTLYACLIECLAAFRPDPATAEGLAGIEIAPEDAEHYPTVPAGSVDPIWLDGRVAGVATMTGSFADVTAAASIAHLHPTFAGMSKNLGLSDFDAATLNDSRARPITQAISQKLQSDPSLNGIKYQSRHGSDLTLWAIFEHEQDKPAECLSSARPFHLYHFDPELLAAFETLGLTWAEVNRGLPPALVEVDSNEIRQAVFPNGDPGPTDPLSAAMRWLLCLRDVDEHLPVLEMLTAEPDEWDFRVASEFLAGRSIAGSVRDSPDPRIKYLGLVSYSGPGCARVTQFTSLEGEVVHLTLTWAEEPGCWQVWGAGVDAVLSPTWMDPPRSEPPKA